MRRSLLVLIALLLALAPGCSGGDDDEAATNAGGDTGEAAVDPKQFGTEDPQFGQLLLQFAKEAEAGDALGMWNMLTSATQASIGPTLGEFRGGPALQFEEGVGSLAPTAEVVVSRHLDDFGLAAIVGDREVEGETDKYAYGVAFMQEENEWKIELGGIVITGLRPEPLSKAPPEPELAANAGAGAELNRVVMYLDGEPFPAERTRSSPFAVSLRGKPSEPLSEDWYTVVTFADSGLTASAIAWTFHVGDKP